MVQEHNVLKCFSCETFQSHIVKKTNKWECKVCGAKQSVKKVYGLGSGKDCRLHTQKLNAIKREKDENIHDCENVEEANKNACSQLENSQQPLTIDMKPGSAKGSKWAEYVADDVYKKLHPAHKCIIRPMDDSIMECGSVLKRKKKYESHVGNEQLHNNNIEFDDSLEKSNSALSFLDSLRSTKKIKFIDCYDKNYNDYQSSDLNHSFKTVEEQLKSPNFKAQKQAKQNIYVKTGLKWAKYLEKPNDMYSQNSTTSPFSKIMSINSGTIQSIHNSSNKSGFISSNSKENKDFLLNNGNITNPCSNLGVFNNSARVPQNLDLLFKMNHETSSVVPLKGNHNTQQKILEGKNQSSIQSLFSLPVFEQNCDLSDSDFQLDFY